MIQLTAMRAATLMMLGLAIAGHDVTLPMIFGPILIELGWEVGKFCIRVWRTAKRDSGSRGVT